MFVFVCMQQCACYQCIPHLQYGCISDASVPSTVLYEKVVIQNQSSEVWSLTRCAKCKGDCWRRGEVGWGDGWTRLGRGYDRSATSPGPCRHLTLVLNSFLKVPRLKSNLRGHQQQQQQQQKDGLDLGSLQSAGLISFICVEQRIL